MTRITGIGNFSRKLDATFGANFKTFRSETSVSQPNSSSPAKGNQCNGRATQAKAHDAIVKLDFLHPLKIARGIDHTHFGTCGIAPWQIGTSDLNFRFVRGPMTDQDCRRVAVSQSGNKIYGAIR
jgi:hypothetical protein